MFALRFFGQRGMTLSLWALILQLWTWTWRMPLLCLGLLVWSRTAGTTQGQWCKESADATIPQPASANLSIADDSRKNTFGFLAAFDPFARLAGEGEEVNQSEEGMSAMVFADEAEPGLNHLKHLCSKKKKKMRDSKKATKVRCGWNLELSQKMSANNVKELSLRRASSLLEEVCHHGPRRLEFSKTSLTRTSVRLCPALMIWLRDLNAY